MVESQPPTGADQQTADFFNEKVTPIQTSVQTNKLKPLFIGVVGGTASGKTSLCQRIEETLGEEVSLISLDSFYKGLSDEDHEDAANYNFDHPDALDFDLAYEKLNELIAGKDVDIPVYDFALHKRIDQTNRIKTAPIIIFEGIHSISESRFRDLMDLKIFVLTPDDIRLKRRIQRDIAERGRTVVEVLQQYNRFVKPAYDDFIKPTMKFADVIVPFWDRNENAIEMLVENLKIKLSKFKIGQQRLQMGISSDDLLSPATNEIKRALLSSGQPKPGLSLPSQEIQDKAGKIICFTQKLIDSNTLDADEIQLQKQMAAAKLDDLLKQSKAAGTSKATYKFELLTEEQLFAVLNKSSHSGCTIQCYGLASDVDIDKIKDRTEFHLQSLTINVDPTKTKWLSTAATQ